MAALLTALVGGNLGAAEFSALWGKAGERWTPQSRLPDFSFAGCFSGDKPLPERPRGVSVRDFGARGDGETDDTTAFRTALERTTNGTIEVPPGRYLITQPLEITRPDTVLRGAGPKSSVLVFSRSLNDIHPAWTTNTGGRRTSSYSWSGGFLSLRGDFHPRPLAAITTAARRGEDWVEVDSVEQLRPGQRVEVFQSDRPDNSLAVHLYSGDAGAVSNLHGHAFTSWICRILRLDGRRVQLDRPMRCEVQLRWSPQIRTFEPDVTGSGVEQLGFEFPNRPYRGHFTEEGFNAVALTGVADCWVRDLHILHADSGLFIGGSFNTVQDVVLESARRPDREGCVGHHGICVTGHDNLITGFDVRARFHHDVGLSHFASGNVFSRGHGADLSLDHHRYAPYENLFTDLDAGAGTRLWMSGGGSALGKHCGARGTFWNIRAARRQHYPPRDFGPPTLNVVGVRTSQASVKRRDGKWFEAIAPVQLHPANLHEAQLERRRTGLAGPEK